MSGWYRDSSNDETTDHLEQPYEADALKRPVTPRNTTLEARQAGQDAAWISTTVESRHQPTASTPQVTGWITWNACGNSSVLTILPE